MGLDETIFFKSKWKNWITEPHRRGAPRAALVAFIRGSFSCHVDYYCTAAPCLVVPNAAR